MFAMTTHGSSPFAQANFQPGDVFVFGSETRGLDPALRESFPPASASACPCGPTTAA
jgi:tRNA (cytidine/uridine-2'-O-)-methyltransferase